MQLAKTDEIKSLFLAHSGKNRFGLLGASNHSTQSLTISRAPEMTRTHSIESAGRSNVRREREGTPPQKEDSQSRALIKPEAASGHSRKDGGTERKKKAAQTSFNSAMGSIVAVASKI